MADEAFGRDGALPGLQGDGQHPDFPGREQLQGRHERGLQVLRPPDGACQRQHRRVGDRSRPAHSDGSGRAEVAHPANRRPDRCPGRERERRELRSGD